MVAALRLLLLGPLESGGHRRRGGHPFVVDPGVFGPVVGPRKPFLAQVTAVRLDARVRPTVPGQLVRPRETPLAPRPHATVRFLARMPPHVNLRIRAQNGTMLLNGRHSDATRNESRGFNRFNALIFHLEYRFHLQKKKQNNIVPAFF